MEKTKHTLHTWLFQLQQYLGRNQQRGTFSNNIWQNGVPIESPNTVVFMGINKTGSSSICAWLETHQISYCMSRYRENDDLKFSLIEQITTRDLNAFALVRNPWDRAVSSWKYCMAKKGLSPCTFKQFLCMPREKMTPQQRYHSGAQWLHIVDRNGEIAYLNHIGRFEDLNATCKWISDTMGFGPKQQLPHLKQMDRGHYSRYYDSETIQKVAQDFSRDIEMFDDGAHDERTAGDGIFAGTFAETDKNGPFVYTVKITGQHRDGRQVERSIIGSFQVGSILQNPVSASEVMTYQQKASKENKSLDPDSDDKSMDLLDRIKEMEGDGLDSFDNLPR